MSEGGQCVGGGQVKPQGPQIIRNYVFVPFTDLELSSREVNPPNKR